MIQIRQKTYNVIFAGTPAFSVPALQAIHQHARLRLSTIVTQPDKPVGRHHTPTPPPVKQAVADWDIPVSQPPSLRTEKFLRWLEGQAPDVVVVIAYGKIIPTPLLAIPRFGWVNAHASLLPRFRGASPIQSAIIAGEKTTGVTLMLLDTGLDTGPIISQRSVPIDPYETGQTLHDRLARLSAEVLTHDLLDYLDGNAEPKPQDNTAATTTALISKADARLDWHESAVTLERRIRAFTPWPGAFTHWGAKRLIIIAASVSREITRLQPGQTMSQANNLLVGTGSGTLVIQNAQIAGKKPQTAAELLRGYPELVHTTFS